MYLDYFGLEKEPFSISPDPSFLYPSPRHRQALAHLKYGLEREGGFILLTGEVGTGKTTLTRLMLKHLPGNIRVAYLLNARLGEQDLLASICQELGISFDSDDKKSVREYIDVLNKELLEAHSQGKKTLLVIEEAQNIAPDVLEMLRLLTNLETNTAKLLHILLVGQPELLDVISRPELRQLNQRVISRYHLQPLDLDETANYLRHRLRRAGCKRPVFDANSSGEIHKISEGVPRLINLLAERCLLGAYASGNVGVTKDIVGNAAIEALGEDVKRSSNPFVLGKSTPASGVGEDTDAAKKTKFLVSGLAVLVVLVAGWFGYQSFTSAHRVDSEPNTANTPTDTEIAAQSLALQPTSSAVSTSVQATSADDEGTAVSTPVENFLPQSGDPSDDSVTETVENFEVVEVQLFSNPYSQLANVWSIDLPSGERDVLCDSVPESGLACGIVKQANLWFLSRTKHPGVIELVVDDKPAANYLITKVGQSSVTLSDSSGDIDISRQTFAESWDGNYVFLWRKPTGYVAPLNVGDRNTSVVNWLQEILVAQDSDYEKLITGGVYSAALSERVKKFQSKIGLKDDGILGRTTIMALNNLAGDSPQIEVTL